MKSPGILKSLSSRHVNAGTLRRGAGSSCQLLVEPPDQPPSSSRIDWRPCARAPRRRGLHRLEHEARQDEPRPRSAFSRRHSSSNPAPDRCRTPRRESTRCASEELRVLRAGIRARDPRTVTSGAAAGDAGPPRCPRSRLELRMLYSGRVSLSPMREISAMTGSVPQPRRDEVPPVRCARIHAAAARPARRPAGPFQVVQPDAQPRGIMGPAGALERARDEGIKLHAVDRVSLR